MLYAAADMPMPNASVTTTNAVSPAVRLRLRTAYRTSSTKSDIISSVLFGALHVDNDLAARVPGFEIRDRLRDLVQRVVAVDHRPDLAGDDEIAHGGQVAL